MVLDSQPFAAGARWISGLVAARGGRFHLLMATLMLVATLAVRAEPPGNGTSMAGDTAQAPAPKVDATMQADASAEALLQAVIDRAPQRVARLLAHGVSPESSRIDGEHAGKTALMWAAESGQTGIIALLLDHGARVDHGNPKGGTALMYAAVSGHADAIRMLVEAGANPDHRVRHGWTPLLLATAKGHVDSVRVLAELGADLDTRDVYGWTLLMRAAERGDTAMVATLLELGLDPAKTDANGTNALALARQHDDLALLELLRPETRAR